MSIEITFVTICSWTILGDEMKNLQDVTEGYLCSYSFYRGGEHFSNRYCMCIVYLKDISKKVLDIVTIVYHWVGVGCSGKPLLLLLISFHPYPMWMVHSESDGFPQTTMWEWVTHYGYGGYIYTSSHSNLEEDTHCVEFESVLIDCITLFHNAKVESRVFARIYLVVWKLMSQG